MASELVKTEYSIRKNYGERDEVRELAERLQIMMPGGQNYTKNEALTLAQIAVAHDLDPFNGEVWLIKNEDTGKIYGALIGIKGHRKHAKRQANYWGVGHNGGFERVTDPVKIKAYGAAENAIVYEYKIMDDVIQDAYSKSIGNLINAGVPYQEAMKLFGPPPVVIGVGVWTPGDKSKMKPGQCAMFRAEKDALKRRFDVKFTVEIEGRMIPVSTNLDKEDDIAHAEIEAEYSEILDEKVSEEEILTELGFAPEQSAPAPDVSAKMSLETAMNTLSSSGKKYGEISTETLSYMANTIANKLRTQGAYEGDKRDEMQFKLDAIRVLLSSERPEPIPEVRAPGNGSEQPPQEPDGL